MVKAYQRYTPRTIFGVIASGNSNIIYDAEGKYAVSPALEDISVWDLKKGELVCQWCYPYLCVNLLVKDKCIHTFQIC